MSKEKLITKGRETASQFYHTLNKRKQVWLYDRKKIPPKEKIQELIDMALEITPSKQNYQPYTINILGPDKENENKFQKEKLKLWSKVVGNHHAIEDRALKEGKIKDSIHVINRNYQHILSAPYVLVLETRLCKNNDYMELGVQESSHFAEQVIETELESLGTLIAMEVGLFCHALTGLCMEEGLDVSFTSCFPKNPKRWPDFSYVNREPHIIMSIGHGDFYRMNFMQKTDQEKMDWKPDHKDIINWVDVDNQPPAHKDINWIEYLTGDKNFVNEKDQGSEKSKFPTRGENPGEVETNINDNINLIDFLDKMVGKK